jgi:hypothetical protein
MAEKILSIGLGINTSKLPSDINEATRIVRDGAAKIGGATDAATEGFKSLSQAVRQSSKDAEIIATYLGTASEEFKTAASRASSYKQQLNEVNSAISNSASTAQSAQLPAIKNISNGYNGLNMSINQLTRELPAFTYSMQTGFMAISNNIPMLVDQLNLLKSRNLELAASGQQTQSTFKSIASAVFSWQSAISIGVTLMTVFGGKIINYIADQYDTAKATEAAALAQKKQNENLETYSRILKGLTTTVQSHNQDLRLQNAAKEAGITVDEMKAINLGKAISEKEKELSDKQKFLNKIDTTEYSGKGKQLYEETSIVVTQLQKQIDALKNYQNVLKESAQLQDKSQELKDLKKNNKQLEDEHKRHVEEIRKMNFEMGMRGGTDEGIYLIQRKKSKNIFTGLVNNDDLKQGIIKNLEAAKLNIPQTVTFTFVAKGLNDIEKAGQRMVVLNDGVKMLGETLKGMIVPALQNFGNSLGKALGGDDVDGGKMLKQMLADVCNSMAMTMYAMAAGYIAIQAYGHAAAATAAGIGLNIAAGVLGAGGASGGVSSGSSGGGGGSINAGIFGNGGMNSNFGVLQVGGEIRGNNLLVSVNRSGYERGRVR